MIITLCIVSTVLFISTLALTFQNLRYRSKCAQIKLELNATKNELNRTKDNPEMSMQAKDLLGNLLVDGAVVITHVMNPEHVLLKSPGR